MDELREIERFAGPDPAAAADALRRLTPALRGMLHKKLAAFVPSAADREDIIVDTLRRLWESRGRYHFAGVGAWFTFVAVIAQRCASDHRRNQGATPLPEIEVPDEDLEAIDVIARYRLELDVVYEAADELWLGLDPNRASRHAKLLAAQLFYLHDRPWEEICAMLGDGEPLSRRDLDSWLRDEATLRHMAFEGLYWENDRLADFACAGACSDAERRVLAWHFRNGIPTDKIVQMGPGLSRAEIERSIVAAPTPFAPFAHRVKRALERGRLGQQCFQNPGLWRRLVFAYTYACDLPQQHVLERTKPAGDVLGYRINIGVINMWTSGGRLVRQLAAHIKEREHAH